MCGVVLKKVMQKGRAWVMVPLGKFHNLMSSLPMFPYSLR